MHDVLDAEKTSLYTSGVAKLNCWEVVDKPDIQHAVSVRSKSTSSLRVND